ncbi:MAG: acyltransferase family protein [Deltaproteobacteria bacterium]|nr:acyltransferase family protein [Deltaproteobacteria bacterium]
MRLAERFRDCVDERFVEVMRQVVRALEAVHPVRMEGLENLPRGPALLVGNHGLLGYETLLFFARLFDATGRVPRGCADRWFFRVPLMRDVLVRVGGMYGSQENALSALGRGHLVVSYPGGVREVFKHEPSQRYRLRWEKSLGFARVALRAGVPIIPFAAAGVDHTYRIVSRLRGTGRLWMGDEKYDLPLLLGRGPLPAPVPFWFRLGRPMLPIAPPVAPSVSRSSARRDGDPDGPDDRAVAAVHRAAWRAAQQLLDEVVAEWSGATRSAARAPRTRARADVTASDLVECAS